MSHNFFCNDEVCDDLVFCQIFQNEGMRCAYHKVIGDVNIHRKRCEACKLYIAHYGPSGEAIRCRACAFVSDREVKTIYCSLCDIYPPVYRLNTKLVKRDLCEDCAMDNSNFEKMKKLCNVCHQERAMHGDVSLETPLRCKNCQLPGDYDFRNKKCETCNSKRALYAPKGEKVRFCRDCRTEDAIDINKSLCITCGVKRPSFGKQGSKKAIHCADCKQDDEIRINSQLCVICGVKYASFGKIGDSKRLYCKTCKRNDDFNIASKKCIVCKTTRASFAPSGSTVAERCGGCRKSNDVDVRNARCIVCMHKIPSFGLPSDASAKRCAQCRIVGDVPKWSKCSTCGEKQNQKDGYCLTCHPNYVATPSGFSREACQFFDTLERELGCEIRHTHLNTEQKVWTRNEYNSPLVTGNLPVDGYFESENGEKIVIEFEGDVWHGHPSLWKDNATAANHKGDLYRDLFYRTENKLQKYFDAGYTVWYIWSSEWLAKKAFQSTKDTVRVFDGSLKPCPNIKRQKTM